MPQLAGAQYGVLDWNPVQLRARQVCALLFAFSLVSDVADFCKAQCSLTPASLALALFSRLCMEHRGKLSTHFFRNVIFISYPPPK